MSTEVAEADFGLPTIRTPVTPGNANPFSFNLFGTLATGLFGHLDYNTEPELASMFAGASFTGTFGTDFAQGRTAPLCNDERAISSSRLPCPKLACLPLLGMGLTGES
ncbi:hypothetical protein [Muricoccus vinaceus]|uniref:Uncharacterized protein n=1 Tax=Muricoccus vinaceus TaxID=424704 RepID=A0ABV6IZF8_9PROT